MSRNEEKQMAKFLPKTKFEPKESPFAMFQKVWYLDWWLPKLLYILGFFAILWKIFDITILGRFP